MKRDPRTLSDIRERLPFVTPPHILIVAEDDGASEAVQLAESLDRCGADAEVRFSDDHTHCAYEPDAVIFAGKRGVRVARHHPVLESVLSFRRP